MTAMAAEAITVMKEAVILEQERKNLPLMNC